MTPLLVQERVFADYVEVGATWRDLPRLYERLEEAFDQRGWRTRIAVEHARLEGACLGCAFWGETGSPAEALESYDAAWKLAAEVCHANGGGLGHVYGGGQHRSALLDDGAKQRLALLTQVKRKLDPVGIMNPGVLGTEP